jgi:hypothetical protein
MRASVPLPNNSYSTGKDISGEYQPGDIKIIKPAGLAGGLYLMSLRALAIEIPVHPR